MILGIDPGLGGALAFYHPGIGLEIHDMPTHIFKINRKLKRRLDLHMLADIISSNGPQAIDFAVVEDVSASPQMGVTSAFSFGWAACAPHAIVAAFKIPVRLVRPAVWKRDLGLSSDKEQSRRLASQLMPESAHMWPLKGHDGRAEAALLAYYGTKIQ